jgi:hypothetical protein
MKKLFLSIAVVAAMVMAVASCKKTKDAINCVDAAKKYSDASNAYFQSQTKANCDAYKAALNDYMNSSCVTPEQKAVLQASAEAITCQ